jgi:hypothetical protein
VDWGVPPRMPLPNAASPPILQLLVERVRLEPFNAIATAIFLLAILHTFAAARFTKQANDVQLAHDASAQARGQPLTPRVWAELLHFLGEVEVIFGLWAIVLLIAIVGYDGLDTAKHYFNDTVSYTEPIFVVVIMALASTRPIISFAQTSLLRVANIGGATPLAWWASILIIGPVLGSFITEPAAMTIAALLPNLDDHLRIAVVEGRQIDLKPPLLVGFFLAGLVIHGGQGWWIAPILGRLSEIPLFLVRRCWRRSTTTR